MAYNFYEPDDMIMPEPDYAVQPYLRSNYAVIPQDYGFPIPETPPPPPIYVAPPTPVYTRSDAMPMPTYVAPPPPPLMRVDDTQWTQMTQPAPVTSGLSALAPSNTYDQALEGLTPEQRAEVLAGLDAAKNFDLGAYQAQYKKVQDAQNAALSAAQATGLSDQYTQLYGGSDIIPGVTQNILTNMGIENPYLPVYTLRGTANKGGDSANERMSFAPLPGMEYRLVDKNTGQVTTASTPQEIKALAEAANEMGKTGGPMANYAIESGQGGKFTTMFEDKPDISKFDRLAGMALPIAVSLIPGLQGVGAVLANAGASAAGAAISGGDPLKGAIMGGLSAAGGQYLGPEIQGVKNAAGKTIATNLGRSVGTAIGSTVGGIATGQPLDKSLLGGAIAGGTTYLGGELFGGGAKDNSLQEWAKEYGIYDLPSQFYDAAPAALAEGFNPINFKTPSITGGSTGYSAPSSFGGISPSSFSGGYQAPGANIIATANVPASTGSSFAVNVPSVTGNFGRDIVATAKKTAEPTNLAVNVPYTGPTDIQVQALRDMFEAERQKALAANVPTQAMGGPDLEEEIIATAQDEGIRQAEGPSFAVNVPTTGDFLKNIDVNALRDAAALEEKGLTVSPYTGVSGPDLEKAIEVTAQKAKPPVEDKPSLAVNVPTTGDFLTDLEVNAPKKPPVDDTNELAVNLNFEDLLSDLGDIDFAGDDDIIVEGDREKVIDDEGAVGGPFIDAGDFLTDIEVNAPKKPAVDDTEELAVDLNFEDLLSDLTDFDLTGDDEIIVEGKDEDVVPDVGPLSIPTNIDAALKDITKPDLTPPEKKTIDDIIKYLRLAGLGIGLVGNIGGGGGGSGSGRYYSGRGSLNPIFSAQLPGAGTGFTVGGLGGGAGGAGGASGVGGTRLPTDWYRYAMGPAMDIPAGVDMRRATSPYAGYGPGTLGEETFRRVTGMSHGGPMGYSRGSSRESFAVEGPGTGRSDDIPAVLSDGEYVIDAETVALLGDGSSKAGAKKLDEMRVKIRKHKGKNLAKGKFSVNAKHPEKYMSGGRI